MEKKFNLRGFVSVSLFFLMIIVFVTAVAIQILDEMIDPKTLIEIYLNPGTQNTLVEILGIIKAIHVVGGFIFIGLSVIHIIKNWKALKGYMKKNEAY
jgi:cytochrome b561